MYADRPERKPWTVPMLADAKREGRRLVMLTAYDAGFARALDDAGVDIVLVGDSLGMTAFRLPPAASLPGRLPSPAPARAR